jgi:CRISPR-associated protein Cas2
LFFVMYDIESDKVRRLIVKYLQRKGCTRVQRSVFLADLPLKEYDNIRADLTEAQSAYDNDDSILVVPVSTDMMQAMRIIGKNIDIDLIMHSSNTLFF